MINDFLDNLGANDTLRIEWPGAGGWGDPLERDPQAVLDDVIAQKVSRDRAEKIYGVVIDSESLRVEKTRTEQLRATRRESPN